MSQRRVFHEVVAVEALATRAHIGKRRARRVSSALEEILDEHFRADDVVLLGRHFFGVKDDPLVAYLVDLPTEKLISIDEARSRVGMKDDEILDCFVNYRFDDDGEMGFVLSDLDGMALVPSSIGEGRMVIDLLHLANEVFQLLGDDQAEEGQQQWLLDAVIAAVELAAEHLDRGGEVRFRLERIAPERLYEDWLVANLDALSRFGIEVELYVAPGGRTGRQHRLADGRVIDLLTRYRDDSGFLVIELKSVAGDSIALEQIRHYMTAIRDSVASPNEVVRGLLIAEGASSEVLEARARGEVQYISWAMLGYAPRP